MSISARTVTLRCTQAFVKWSPSDSLYGARKLAERWSRTRDASRNVHLVPAPGGARQAQTKLASMRLLVLLDLLGHRGAKVTWHFDNTRPLFSRLRAVEKLLRGKGLLVGNAGEDYLSETPVRGRGRGGISDDHIPFLQRNVPVLHLIAR